MPRFAYRALTADGSSTIGDVLADTEVQALEELARRGLVPVSLDRGVSDADLRWWQRDVSLFGTPGQLSPKELENIFSMMGSLLSARLPLLRALSFCHDQTSDPRSRRMLAALRRSVENGSSLAAAMADCGPAVPERLIALVASGEASNRLEDVMKRTARALTAEAQISRDLRGALIYPGLLLGLAVLVLGMIAFYLAPTLLPVFSASGVPAPLPLRALAGVGETIRTGWPVLLAALAVAFVMLSLLRAQVSLALGRLSHWLPVIGPHLRRRETLRITQTLGLMLDSGAPMIKALAAARDSLRSPSYVALLSETEQEIAAGGTLTSVLGASDLIDPMARTLITAGEEADRLVEAIATTNGLLEAQITQGIAQAVRLLTPILTLAIGLGVGSVILATISAIMDLNDLAI
jgi:type II secretory pathway component PulF